MAPAVALAIFTPLDEIGMVAAAGVRGAALLMSGAAAVATYNALSARRDRDPTQVALELDIIEGKSHEFSHRYGFDPSDALSFPFWRSMFFKNMCIMYFSN